MKKVSDVDAYINQFPASTQRLLTQVRTAIQSVAKNAEEGISYGMPSYKLNGILVYFAGYEHHIGFYPTSSGIIAFADEIKKYKHSKGAIQFPIDGKMPIALIKKIVKHRIQVNEEKAALKKKK